MDSLNRPDNSGKNKKRYDRPALVHASRKTLYSMLRYILVFGISFVILYPFLIKISVSFMSVSDLRDLTVKWVPKSPTLETFKFAIQFTDYWKSLFNTVLLTAIVTVLQVNVSTMAAYAFARLKFPLSKIVLLITIATLIIPPQISIIPLYSTFRTIDPFQLITLFTGKSGVLNTHLPMIIMSFFGMGIRAGLYVYILTQFFRNIPNEIEEAAQVDGAGLVSTYTTIMLPNAIPAIVTVSVFSIVWQWNDSFYLSFLSPQVRYLSTSLASLDQLIRAQNVNFVQPPEIISASKNAAALLIALPLVLVFIFAQKYFVENLERSGIVG